MIVCIGVYSHVSGQFYMCSRVFAYRSNLRARFLKEFACESHRRDLYCLCSLVFSFKSIHKDRF